MKLARCHPLEYWSEGVVEWWKTLLECRSGGVLEPSIQGGWGHPPSNFPSLHHSSSPPHHSSTPSSYGITVKLLLLLCLISSFGWSETVTGPFIMDESFKRHELFPYVFEEQTIVLIDNAGNRETRKLRRFSRIEESGAVKYLFVFDTPTEIQGVALLGIHGQSSIIYLPALGAITKSGSENNRGSYFLGTDFAIEDLTAEFSSSFRYVRVNDQEIDKRLCFVVEAFPQGSNIEATTGYGLRRHFIRQDNFFIVRTDYFDHGGRFIKRQTAHDLKNVNGEMWRANMILMENDREQHKTLIKINRRVFSRDYVPSEIFTTEWLLANRHIRTINDMLVENAN